MITDLEYGQLVVHMGEHLGAVIEACLIVRDGKKLEDRDDEALMQLQLAMDKVENVGTRSSTAQGRARQVLVGVLRRGLEILGEDANGQA